MRVNYINPTFNATTGSIWKESFEDLVKLAKKETPEERLQKLNMQKRAAANERKRVQARIKKEEFDTLLKAEQRERKRQARADFLLKTLSYGAVKKEIKLYL